MERRSQTRRVSRLSTSRVRDRRSICDSKYLLHLYAFVFIRGSKFMAKEIELKLKEGDKAPDFSAATNGGGNVSLSDFKGKNVIRFF